MNLSSQVRESSGVVKQGSVDRVGEVALEDAHGLSTSVAMGAGLVVHPAGAGFEAESDHRRAMDRGVEAAVASA
jgi:hypothetical protein